MDRRVKTVAGLLSQAGLSWQLAPSSVPPGERKAVQALEAAGQIPCTSCRQRKLDWLSWWDCLQLPPSNRNK